MSLRRDLLRNQSNIDDNNEGKDGIFSMSSSSYSMQLQADNNNVPLEEENHVDELLQQNPNRTFLFGWSAAEWIELLASIALLIPGLALEFGAIPVWQRPIPSQLLESNDGGENSYIRDLLYDQEDRGHTVPTGMLMGIVIGALIVQLILSSSLLFFRNRDVHRSLCSFLCTFALTILAIDFVKIYCGYLRPVFYAVCEPDDTFESCQGEDSDEARKSFPSGHAGLAFSSLGSLFLYIHRRFGMGLIHEYGVESTNNNSKASSLICRRWISIGASLATLLLALFVAASRVHDNRHHPADVIGGSVMGFSVAAFCHSLWFVAPAAA